MTLRKSTWIDQINVRIRSVDERPDNQPGDEIYVVKDIFTTVDGSWEPSGEFCSVPAWARDAYLRPWGAPDYFDDAGGDHNLFARVLDQAGNPLRRKGIIFWTGGFAKLGDPTYTEYTLRETKERSGWANVPIFNGFYPDQGQSGAWCWCPFGVPAEVVQGGGLPYNRHVSTFVVWQAVPRPVVTTPPPVVTTPPPVVTTPPPVVTTPPPVVTTPPPVVTTPPPVVYPPGLDGVRQRAWDEVGVNYNPEAAFSRYAREQGLGIPLTNEFDIHEFRAQGFVGGIVYAPVGQWDQVSHIDW